MARYGSEGIRGHGIPEVMEQVLRNQSRILPRLTFLKPISAAVAIGTGGPFGADPIIATGGALGSLIGQLLKTTADERKILLSAGAAAGMAATFGSPVSGVLVAVELLLFEFRPRSLIPVTFACVAATAVRMAFLGSAPIFAMPNSWATQSDRTGSVRAPRGHCGRCLRWRYTRCLPFRRCVWLVTYPLDVVACAWRARRRRPRVLDSANLGRGIRQHKAGALRSAL